MILFEVLLGKLEFGDFFGGIVEGFIVVGTIGELFWIMFEGG